jgi:ABC-type long-subunit fatty acid transport system fused permease/ATPase subunit
LPPTRHSLDLTLGFIDAVLTLLSFIGILWPLSAEISFDLGGRTLSFPGYLVWTACANAAAGSWLAHLIGHPLIGLSFQQQRVEADFRFALARMDDASYGADRRNLSLLRCRTRVLLTAGYGSARSPDPNDHVASHAIRAA